MMRVPEGPHYKWAFGVTVPVANLNSHLERRWLLCSEWSMWEVDCKGRPGTIILTIDAERGCSSLTVSDWRSIKF
jgi:hypothetical protein